MKWEKVAERENDFNKNCLVYEAFVDNFPKVFRMQHPDFLTIRRGMSYTHYISQESSSALSGFMQKKIRQQPGFMDDIMCTASRLFRELMDFCRSVPDPEKLSNKELRDFLSKYYQLYKEPYPYFLISVDARPLKNAKTESARIVIDKMAKIRLFSRANFNKTHKLISPLFTEIAKRFKISVEELKFLSPDETLALLEGKAIDIKQKNTDRQKCIFIHTNGKVELHENATMIIHDDEGLTDSTEISGQGAHPGIYKGRVRLIRTIEDMKSLKGGEVIVTQMTTTDLLGAGMSKVGAIVTDEGGITCHAAILSRELGIPAVIGTKTATIKLKNNELVIVDSKKGIIRKIDEKIKASSIQKI